MFINVEGREEQRSGGSWMNNNEVQQCAQVVEALLAAGNPVQSIGVITPYAAQVRALNDCIQPLARRYASAHAPHAAHSDDQWLNGGGATAELEVKSVDGFQGREKEVIVFSAVRCNVNGQVGFLKDWRRLNVAITRAKRGLVIIGHAPTLAAGDKYWAALVAHAQAQGCMLHSADLNLNRNLPGQGVKRSQFTWNRQ